MKVQTFFLPAWMLLGIFLFLSCSNSDEINSPELTFEEKEILFLKDFREKVRGSWEIDKMIIAKNYIFSDPQNDSIVVNPGRIHINNIHNDPVNVDKYNQLEAFFYINSDIIPFKSRLLAFPSENDYSELDVFGLIEPDYYLPYPVPSDSFPDGYKFLNNYFFMDNYTMTLSEDGKTWTWKGLNRFIREIVLRKN
ncbi:hypothetical protein LJC57_01350 [Parabacteroides sp. OttesenSCG-928-G07]|nr:hypothetical protein [Parabacteroides sp. OttesenSCG-928-G07]